MIADRRTVDHPELVPGVLLGSNDDAPGAGRRTGRDRLVDALVLLVALGGGLLTVGVTPDGPRGVALALDLAVGLAGALALLQRRRLALEIGLVLSVASAVVVSVGPASLIAVFAIAVHRRLGPALAVGTLNVLAAAVLVVVYPGPDPFWVTISFGVVVVLATVAWGAFVRARRQLVQSLRDRADRADSEQRLRVEQARQAERSRIAREMHDVVSHRVSLVALHAGALQVRPDLPTEQVRATAELIATSAQDALDELRSVIGVLREQGPGMEVPQPRLDDIAELVERSRRAGVQVDLAMDVEGPGQAPGALGRDAYRVVQEGLTNALKHAPGAATSVTVRGGPGRGLRVSVRNALPAGPVLGAPRGAGAGLLGLTERVALSGGAFTHGPDRGEFVVDADLRWPA